MAYEHIHLCEHCISAIKSRGEKVFVGPMLERELDLNDEGYWYINDDLKCEWCEDNDEELYDCHF